MQRPRENGAIAAEYALILALIFLVIVAAVSQLGEMAAALFVGEWPW